MSLLSDGFAGSAGPLLGPPLANIPLANVSIDLNKTVLLQMVIFAVLIVVLKPLLFDPILKFSRCAKSAPKARVSVPGKLQLKAGDLLTRYEKELERINQAAAVERDKARAETAKLEAEILNEAREVTQRVEQEGRERIEQEVTELRSDLQKQSSRDGA